jgi:hypothetical protein
VLDVLRRAQFDVSDIIRRAQGDVVGAFGLSASNALQCVSLTPYDALS